nr:MalY/PatB family protein [Companilactobacillus metriopterae]
MMQYNFDKEIDRSNTNSEKWNISKNELPMWVADMDFEVYPGIVDVMKKRIEQPTFGYNTIPSSFNESIINWWLNRYNTKLESSWIMFSTGVIPSISSIIRKVTDINDAVVVLSPVYNIFYNSISNNGRKILDSQMIYNDGKYSIDFTDLESKLSLPETSMMIFCNPHNPIGKVWDRDTLKKIGELCIKHDVILLSDEIHADVTALGITYNPFISISSEISDKLIMCISPTKTFNIAGLQTSAVVIPNDKLRERVRSGLNRDEIAEPNTFAIQALEAAYTYDGSVWVDKLRHYLHRNKRYIIDRLNMEIPEVKIIDEEGTYLLWIDLSQITNDSKLYCDELRSTTGLYLNPGSMYGGNSGSFVRWNFATSLSRIEDGVDRFIKFVKSN